MFLFFYLGILLSSSHSGLLFIYYLSLYWTEAEIESYFAPFNCSHVFLSNKTVNACERRQPLPCNLLVMLLLLVLTCLSWVSPMGSKNASKSICVVLSLSLSLSLSLYVSVQRLPGNMNSEAVVQNKLSHSIRTRFLRLLPLDWNPSGWLGLRVEVYGCAYSESPPPWQLLQHPH